LKKLSKNNNLLIAGGTGFIGKNVAKHALNKGFNVTIISKNKLSLSKKINKVEYINVDINDKRRLFLKLKNRSFNYVINLSGYVNHANYFNGGNEIFDTHFNGTVNLVECVNNKTLKNFIQIGSSDEYGSNISPQIEQMREKPISPYSCAKVAATHFLQMLHKTHKFPVIILRLFLVYGIGQKNNRFIPQVIEGCIKKKSFPVSSGNQIRDFCYIDDVVKAIISSLRNKKSFGEVINIASGNPVKIKHVINSIIKKVGFGKADFGKIKHRDFENMKLYADVTKAKKLLKWKPTTALDQGLDLIINSKLKNE
jgi:nucleoside-diphosphate-sugar epimerase